MDNFIFGLIGKPLKHSFSKDYFAYKFSLEGINNSVYNLYKLDRVSLVKQTFKIENLKGLNVTIPYKKEIIRYLDQLDEIAEEIGAVNCIKIEKGKKIGYNTDWIGFFKLIEPFIQPQHKQALILGTGGASVAVQYALFQMDIPYTLVSSSNPNLLSYKDLTEEIISQHQIVIQCTPVGSFPKVDECVDFPYKHLTSNHLCVDLIYNPEETLFMKKSKLFDATVCNGFEMLKIQADESWKIWNDSCIL
jgi:shikimate dehydrogenase